MTSVDRKPWSMSVTSTVAGDEEIMGRWESKNGVTFTKKDDMDIDSFKEAVDGVDEWFVEQLKDAGYKDGQELVELFEK